MPSPLPLRRHSACPDTGRERSEESHARSPLSPQRLAARFTPKARNKTSTNNSATRTFGVRWLLALRNEGCHRLAQLNSPTKLPRVAKSVHTACSGQLRPGQLPLPFVLPVGLAERVSLCGAGFSPAKNNCLASDFRLRALCASLRKMRAILARIRGARFFVVRAQVVWRA